MYNHVMRHTPGHGISTVFLESCVNVKLTFPQLWGPLHRSMINMMEAFVFNYLPNIKYSIVETTKLVYRS